MILYARASKSGQIERGADRAISVPRIVLPVTFASGRAKLATNPARTGSPTAIMTIGIVVVVCLAACVAALPEVTMTSTGSLASSLAAAASRSGCPCPD